MFYNSKNQLIKDMKEISFNSANLQLYFITGFMHSNYIYIYIYIYKNKTHIGEHKHIQLHMVNVVDGVNAIHYIYIYIYTHTHTHYHQNR